MAIVLNGSGTVTGITGITGTNATVTGITSVSSNATNTPVILQDSSTGTNTCRAWVNFNGTGTVAIRASFNVSSITDNGTGDYTINFTNAFADANYSIVGLAQGGGGGVNTPGFCGKSSGTYSASAVQIFTFNTSSGAGSDLPIINTSVFR